MRGRGPPGPPLLTLLTLLLTLLLPWVEAQEPLVVLRQGTLRGIRVFTETRMPINAFLGIPYAVPPVGERRFAAPERHGGWNGSLFAGSWRPACPQPAAPAAAAGPVATDEDCLTLNVWAPDTVHYRPLPVVLLLEGYEWVTGAPKRFPGHDLAAEGLVVVSASYRLNVFGFLCLESGEARGNAGLLDQYVALLWVRENIALFRGDPGAITLLGHGAGAAAAALHLASPRTAGLFQRAALMSGSAASPWMRARPAAEVAAASRGIARSLGCLPGGAAAADTAAVLACLRAKPAGDLLRAFEAQYQNGNWSELVGPVLDTFLPEGERYLPQEPLGALAAGAAAVPVLTGVTSAEGTSTLGQWGDLPRQGGAAVRRFLLETALPHALQRHGALAEPPAAAAAAGALARWRYADRPPDSDPAALRAALLQAGPGAQLFAETRVLAPHHRQLQLLAASPEPVFAYAFDQPGAPDPFSAAPLNVSGAGAPHGSDLLYLLGPTAMLQTAGRRFSAPEERLSKSLKRLWAEFARRGEPTQGGYGYGLSWRRYSGTGADWATLLDTPSARGPAPAPAGPALAAAAREADSFWNSLLPRMRELAAGTGPQPDGEPGTPGSQRGGDGDSAQPFRSATYTLVGFVAALLILLVACLVLLKRRAKERERDLF